MNDLTLTKACPTNLPPGEIIKTPPPPIAPNPRNANKARKIFLAIGFMIFYLLKQFVPGEFITTLFP